jgi:CDP-paratose 2-epimerase
MINKILITGVAGFIGSNTADRLMSRGKDVIGIDNLSRPGTEKNLKWLKEKYKGWKFYLKDIRDAGSMMQIVKKEKPDAVIHLAGQVAVTTSVLDPQTDRAINIDGTVNLLEAVRSVEVNTPFLYSSTNKVYGGLEDRKVIRLGDRYTFFDKDVREHGISEEQNLDFHSPYGCSKGAADQYVHDYSRIYGMPTVVARQSCIYGRRQFGNEDQGWVIHFARKAVEKSPINIYGDGMQVRDILDVNDLVDFYEVALSKIDKIKGQIFNIGGGSGNTVSLLELLDILKNKLGYRMKTKFGDWRPGDQKIYVSDIRKAKKMLDWSPKINVSQGIEELITWAREIS